MENLTILLETPALAVCLKPPGVLSQQGKPGQADMPALLERQLGGPFFPVHRLDREVGGVMVYARNQKAAGDLTRQLQNGGLEKEYLAVLKGVPAAPEGLLRDLLYHDQRKNKTFVVKRERKGVREARLLYRTLETRQDLTLVQVRLLTGRTHQIRAQFSSRGLPLLGDGRYGGGSGAICLWSMALTLELQGARQRFSALPDTLGPFSPERDPGPMPLPEAD